MKCIQANTCRFFYHENMTSFLNHSYAKGPFCVVRLNCHFNCATEVSTHFMSNFVIPNKIVFLSYKKNLTDKAPLLLNFIAHITQHSMSRRTIRIICHCTSLTIHLYYRVRGSLGGARPRPRGSLPWGRGRRR